MVESKKKNKPKLDEIDWKEVNLYKFAYLIYQQVALEIISILGPINLPENHIQKELLTEGNLKLITFLSNPQTEYFIS